MRQIDSRKFFSAIANLDRWQAITNLRRLKKRVNRATVKLSGPATVNAFNYFDLNYVRKYLRIISFSLFFPLSLSLFNLHDLTFKLIFFIQKFLPVFFNRHFLPLVAHQPLILEQLARQLGMKLFMHLMMKANNMTKLVIYVIGGQLRLKENIINELNVSLRNLKILENQLLDSSSMVLTLKVKIQVSNLIVSDKDENMMIE